MIERSLWAEEYSNLASALEASEFEAVDAPGIAMPRFGIASVHEVELMDEGDNDGPPLIALGTLCDGRWFVVEAWRDYTGWGCKDGGSVRVGADRATVERFGLSNEARQRFGIVLA